MPPESSDKLSSSFSFEDLAPLFKRSKRTDSVAPLPILDLSGDEVTTVPRQIQGEDGSNIPVDLDYIQDHFLKNFGPEKLFGAHFIANEDELKRPRHQTVTDLALPFIHYVVNTFEKDQLMDDLESFKNYFGLTRRSQMLKRRLEMILNKNKDDLAFILAIVRLKRSYRCGISLFTYIDGDRFGDNAEIALAAVDWAGSLQLSFASGRLKDDKEFFLKVVKQAGISLQYASKKLCDDYEVVREAVRRDGSAFEYASVKLRDDETLALYAVTMGSNPGVDYGANGSSPLKHCSLRLRDLEPLVYAAISRDGDSFQYASDRLRDNTDLALFAVGQSNGRAFEFCSERIRGGGGSSGSSGLRLGSNDCLGSDEESSVRRVRKLYEEEIRRDQEEEASSEEDVISANGGGIFEGIRRVGSRHHESPVRDSDGDSSMS